MAFDAEMLARAEEGFASWRVYTWETPWVTLGQRQQACSALIFDGAEVPYTHRPTGGLAVLHGHDLTFSYAKPLSDLGGEARKVRAVFEALTEPLVEAFDGQVFRGGTANQVGTSEDCFSGAGEYDLVDADGHKVCGCAMRVTRGAALLQASIPLHAPGLDPGSVIFGGVPFAGRDRQASDLVAGLARALSGTEVASRRGFLS